MVGNRLAVIVVSAVLMCSGCALSPSIPGTDSSPSPTTPAQTPLAKIDSALIEGLQPAQLKGADVDVTIPAVKGATSLNLAAQIVRNKLLRDRAKTGGTLTVSWHAIASSDDLLGLHLTTTRVDAAGAQKSVPVSLWYDETAHFVATGGVLIDPAKWDAFSDAVISEVTEQSGNALKAAEALTLPGAPQSGGPAIGFGADGSLIVTFGPGIGPDSDAFAVVLDKDTSESWLSPFGLNARGASEYPTRYRPGLTEPATPLPSSAASQTRPNIDVVGDCAKRKCIALTFDDGPGPRSAEVAKAFVKAGAGATFFMLGDQIEAAPKTVSEIALTGNEIGSHTWRHKALTASDNTPARNQLNRNSSALQKLTGDWPIMVRPPYGDHNPRIDKIFASEGQIIAQWDVDTLDWKTKAIDPTVASAAGAQAGSIVLMHDIHSWTVDSVPSIIERLTVNGNELVPMSEIASPNSWKVGTAYCAAPWVGRECW